MTAPRFFNTFEYISQDSLDFWPWKKHGVQRVTIHKNASVAKLPALNIVASAQSGHRPIAIHPAMKAAYYTGLTWTQSEIVTNGLTASYIIRNTKKFRFHRVWMSCARTYFQASWETPFCSLCLRIGTMLLRPAVNTLMESSCRATAYFAVWGCQAKKRTTPSFLQISNPHIGCQAEKRTTPSFLQISNPHIGCQAEKRTTPPSYKHQTNIHGTTRRNAPPLLPTNIKPTYRVPGEETHHPLLPTNIKPTYRVPGKETHHPLLPTNIKPTYRVPGEETHHPSFLQTSNQHTGCQAKKHTTPSFLQTSNPHTGCHTLDNNRLLCSLV